MFFTMSILTSADAFELVAEQGFAIVIPDEYTSIESHAFAIQSLISVTIPNSVTTIGDNAFFGNRLTSVVIGDGVTTIGDSAFDHNELTSVVIPDSTTTIGDFAFYDRYEIGDDKSIELYDITQDVIFRFKNSKTGEIALDKYSTNDLGYSELVTSGPLYATPKKLDVEWLNWPNDLYYHINHPGRFTSVGEGQIVSSKYGEHWVLEIGWLKEDGYYDLSGYNFLAQKEQ